MILLFCLQTQDVSLCWQALATGSHAALMGVLPGDHSASLQPSWSLFRFALTFYCILDILYLCKFAQCRKQSFTSIDKPVMRYKLSCLVLTLGLNKLCHLIARYVCLLCCAAMDVLLHYKICQFSYDAVSIPRVYASILSCMICVVMEGYSSCCLRSFCASLAIRYEFVCKITTSRITTVFRNLIQLKVERVDSAYSGRRNLCLCAVANYQTLRSATKHAGAHQREHRIQHDQGCVPDLQGQATIRHGRRPSGWRAFRQGGRPSWGQSGR